MSTLVNRQKRKQLLTMLDSGLVMLHLDPRREDVAVPECFLQDPVLRLNIAWAFNLPVFDVGPKGVYATLSFKRRDFGCTLPWGSIFAMTHPDEGHLGMLWPESVPTELRPYFDQLERGGSAVAVTLEPQGAVRRHSDHMAPISVRSRISHLRVLDGGLEASGAQRASSDLQARPHLYVVK